MPYPATSVGCQERHGSKSAGRRIVRVVLSGELDLSVTESLTELLRPTEDADDAILDFSDVTYMDSTALGCLIHVKNRLIERGGGKVYLLGLRPDVRRIFTITQLDQIFEIADVPK